MTSHIDQVRALLGEAGKLPTSHVKFDLLDEAIRIADLHQDVRLGIEARLPFLPVARELLRGDRMAVAFTWCLHQYDQQPGLFNGRNLLSEYADLIGKLANFDTITRRQIEDMFSDLRERTLRAGESLASYWKQRWIVSHDLGDAALSREAAREMERLGPTKLWEPDDRFHQAVYVGDDDEAVRIAEAELFAGKWEKRWSTYWHGFLLLLLKRGRAADLRKWRKKMIGRRELRDSYHWEFGPLVIALGLGGRTAEAVTLAGKCQRTIREFTDPLTRLHFSIDIGVLFDRLHAVGRESVLVRFNDLAPGRLPNGRYVVAEGRDWLNRQATELAERFDRRNGTDHYAGLIRRRAALQPFALPEEA